MISTLPALPSALIRVALKDLKTCEDADGYTIQMSMWHSPRESGNVCAVCMAGSVMAQTLHASPLGMYNPIDYTWDVSNSLHAINMFRRGYVKVGLSTMLQPAVMGNREIVRYENDRDLFYVQMNELADDFEGLGI